MTIIRGCCPSFVTFWKRRFTKACPGHFANHLNVNNTSYITKTCVFHLISSRNLFQCHLQLKSDLSTMKNKENLPTSALLQFKMADKMGKTASELLCKRAHEAVCVCLLEQITCTYFLFISVSMDNAVSQDPCSTLTQLHTLTHLGAALYTRSGLYSSVGQRVLLRSTWAVVMYKLQ